MIRLIRLGEAQTRPGLTKQNLTKLSSLDCPVLRIGYTLCKHISRRGRDRPKLLTPFNAGIVTAVGLVCGEEGTRKLVSISGVGKELGLVPVSFSLLTPKLKVEVIDRSLELGTLWWYSP